MYTYINGENRLVISNMAWEPKNDDHAIFLMKRYGVKNVEIVPTKYTTWEENFENPTFHEKYIAAGIRVYSLQSVLYGVKSDFNITSSETLEHLKKVAKLCERVGARAIVIGSPKKRLLVSKGSTLISEMLISGVLQQVQESTDVDICLEPNSRQYGCEVGYDLESCSRMVSGRNFGINFDTGNFMMEHDIIPANWDVTKVKHCQVSAPFLRDIHFMDYDKMKYSTITNILASMDKNVKISLETKVNIYDLGEQIRRFASFIGEIDK